MNARLRRPDGTLFSGPWRASGYCSDCERDAGRGALPPECLQGRGRNELGQCRSNQDLARDPNTPVEKMVGLLETNPIVALENPALPLLLVERPVLAVSVVRAKLDRAEFFLGKEVDDAASAWRAKLVAFAVVRMTARAVACEDQDEAPQTVEAMRKTRPLPSLEDVQLALCHLTEGRRRAGWKKARVRLHNQWTKSAPWPSQPNAMMETFWGALSTAARLGNGCSGEGARLALMKVRHVAVWPLNKSDVLLWAQARLAEAEWQREALRAIGEGREPPT